MTLKYIDLFCGLGAFHTAFEDFECVFACDIDPGIRAIYKTNQGMDIHDDIRTVDASQLPDFDILCAGFPCQPFSIAGNGEGFQDTEKGNLFQDILKIMDVKKPPLCILENVKNLKTHDDGNTQATIERELTSRGYTVTSKVLNASEFGSPQARQRIFIVAAQGPAFPIPDGTGETRTVETILDPSVDFNELNGDKYQLEPRPSAERNPAKPKILQNVVDKKSGKGGRQGERVQDVSHVGITVCASSGGPGAKTGLYQIGDTIRRLTVQETLGMFGFPRDQNFSDVTAEKARFYLGNSIVVNVAKAFVGPIRTWFTARSSSPPDSS